MHGEQPQRSAVDQLVMDEVEAPAFVGPLRRGGWFGSAPDALLTPTTLPDLQPFGAVDPVHALVVVGDPVAAQ